MNLFLSTLSSSGVPVGIFFSDDLSKIVDVNFERNDFFLDRLAKFQELKKVQKIFYVAGPASFTSLRNMSVFLNVFTSFSKFSDEDEKIDLYKISTGEFFNMSFPNSDAHVLSVGRRESFIFTGDGYKKHKNIEALSVLQEISKKKTENLGEDLVISGEFSENFLERQQEEFSDVIFEFPISQKEFLTKILKNSKKFLQKNSRAAVDYGALPNIG